MFLFPKSGNSGYCLSTKQTTNNLSVKFDIKWALSSEALPLAQG